MRQLCWAKIMASQRELISCDAEVSLRQVADIVGISNVSAYYILAALVGKGFVKLSNFKKNSSRGSNAYLLTLKGIWKKQLLILHFIERKCQELEDLRTEIGALEHDAELSIGEESASELKKVIKVRNISTLFCASRVNSFCENLGFLE